MRKFLITLVILSLSCGTAAAQAFSHEINLYVGGYNSSYQNPDISFGYSDLYSLYEPQTRFSSDIVYTLDYNYAILEWLSVGMLLQYNDLNVSTVTRINYDHVFSMREMFSILPGAKLRIPSGTRFRLYSRVAMGISIVPQYAIRFAYDVVPIAFEWGSRRVYATGELVLGSVVKGTRFGIGFRF